MPRRDLTEERTEQILDAFERCIVKHGFEGSSLEKIGEEAGMKRTILRHYIGNREEIIEALARRVVGRWREELVELEEAERGADPHEALVEYLFYDEKGGSSAHDILVAESLIASAERYPAIGVLMRQYIEEFTGVVSRRLAIVHPHANRAERWSIAYGITSVLLSDASLTPLKLPGKFRKAARNSVSALIRSVGEK